MIFYKSNPSENIIRIMRRIVEGENFTLMSMNAYLDRARGARRGLQLHVWHDGKAVSQRSKKKNTRNEKTHFLFCALLRLGVDPTRLALDLA
jgi:hypothetical protein